MSDKKHRTESFTNEDTIVRRAWIDSALESVRGRLNTAYPDPDPATAGTGVDGEEKDDAEQSAGAAKPHETGTCRRHLYVAWSSPERRSGT
ncbi:MAG: hypothetical protein CL799_12325 [Chromatiales bacterium]|jgi:hypothetical protein|nr:hypothetical protein [Chromatiales bacterium]MDP6151301.1 hypothetical protein [Gammaproteobacteria bacterium]MDP7093957.1 hypothetical protein [Gammaproteobacteria bacterium]MDP7270293.1 hypothetical protein [Gammaproteobacteria bacterium]HJP05269.1 hypothetical protein [Gammaproteobacteria bacterium]